MATVTLSNLKWPQLASLFYQSSFQYQNNQQGLPFFVVCVCVCARAGACVLVSLFACFSVVVFCFCFFWFVVVVLFVFSQQYITLQTAKM